MAWLDLRRDDLQQAALGCLEVLAVQFEHAVLADRHVRHAVVARAGSPSATRGSPSTSRRTPREAERLARAGDHRLQRVLAAQHAARERREQLRLRGGPPRLARAAGGLVDDVAHEQRVRDVEHEREELPGVGDRERVQRLDEEEVEREARTAPPRTGPARCRR